MQYINISRDIVSDSVTVGRVYIPTDYMEDPENDLRIMGKEKNARALGDEKLRRYISRLMQLADNEYSEALKCIEYMPSEVKFQYLACSEIFQQGYINAIHRTSPTALSKPAARKLDKLWIAIKALYF